MFIEEKDFLTLVDAKTLELLQQADTDNRDRAQAMALDEISSYLCGRFDTQAAFSRQAKERNQFLVLIALDITLYHLISWLPKRMGMEQREKRYEQALEWLIGVRDSKLNPNLDPLLPKRQQGSTIIIASEPRDSYSW